MARTTTTIAVTTSNSEADVLSTATTGPNAADSQSEASMPTTDHITEKAAGPPPTKRQKIRRHCHRFWLWYLIASIVFLAIFLPILFKLIIPAIVQAVINGQRLPVEWGSLDCISSTQVRVAVNTSFDSPLPARVGTFTVDWYNKNTQPYSPFVNLIVKGQKINGDTKIAIPPQLLNIQNETEIITFFDKVFTENKVDLSIKGSPTVFLGALDEHPKLEKTLQFASLRNLSGSSIEKLNLMLPPQKDGNNIKGTIKIPNFSVLTLNFGNITFAVFSGKVRIGHITLYDVLLNIGNNTINFDGKLDFPNLAKNLGPILQSQTAALSRGQLELNVTGTQVMVNGSRIPYIEQVLSKRQITTSISVVTLLSGVVGAVLGSSSASLVNVFGEVMGNSTFLQHVIDNYNTTQLTKNSTNPSLSTKRAPNPKEAIMWNMLKMGLRMKLNQVQR